MSSKFRRLAFTTLVPLALGLTCLSAGAAEKPKKAASPFQGFSSDNGKPVNVKSETLEVHQEEQKAIFRGHVVAVQGDSTLRTNELTVFYDNANAGQNSAAATPSTGKGEQPANGQQPAEQKPGPATSPSQANSIKRLIAKGNVIVTSKDQKATGDAGDFDMATNLAVLTGKEVVLIQDGNVVKGNKLTVNLKTGISHVDADGSTGVTGVFIQQKSPSPQ